MVLWQHVMLCRNKLLRVQLVRCASLCYVTRDWPVPHYVGCLQNRESNYSICHIMFVCLSACQFVRLSVPPSVFLSGQMK